ncbi:MAG: cell division protein ZapA [Desulfuromonadaceae bacterium]|nr:cell division protein ZapA [Desulfuromonadaceae bacterium]
MKHRVEVAIRGRQYTFRSSRSQQEILKAAEFVDARIAEVLAVGATADSQQATVLAFMNVAGLYLELLQAQNDDQELKQRLAALDQKLSVALSC